MMCSIKTETFHTSSVNGLAVILKRARQQQFYQKYVTLFSLVNPDALGPTQPPIQWVPGAPSLREKRPSRGADHSPLSSAKVEECVELYLHSNNTPSWRGAQIKQRNNFTFYL
jgi:hypothetical protein